MFEFVFAQMTKANTRSCNKFNSSMISTFKNIIWGWPDKTEDIVFKSTKASNISNFKVKIVRQQLREKKNFWKSCFVLKRGMFSLFLAV